MGSRAVDKLLKLAREKKEKEKAQSERRSAALPRVEDICPELAMLTAPVDDDDSFPSFDSELYERLLLEEKYFTYNDDWIKGKSPDTMYQMRIKQERLIKERVKNLLTAIIKFGSLDDAHDCELRFLLENFYAVSDYAIERDLLLSRIADKRESVNAAYVDIINLAFSMRDLSSDEVYWEINKYFDYSKRLSFENDVCNFEYDVNTVKGRLKSAQTFELDMLLASAIGNTSYYAECDGQGVKERIRLLIKSGARLNTALLSCPCGDSFYLKRLSELTYAQFVSCRDENLTQELLLSLSDMPLSEIRQIFFERNRETGCI